MVVVVSSYIFCVLLLFTCRGEVNVGKRTNIFVQKLLRIIDCQNGGLRNLSSLCTALLVQKLSVRFFYPCLKIGGAFSASSQAVCEFGPAYLLPNGLKSFYIRHVHVLSHGRLIVR